jgi:aryl carrier-like protein
MLKQIIPTCEEKPTYEDWMAKNEIDTIKYVKDKFMMNECCNFTKNMIEAGMDIDRICELVKDYQQKYIYIQNKCPDLAKKYTMEMWFKTM